MNSDSVKIGARSFLQRTTEVFPKYLNRHATSEGGGGGGVEGDRPCPFLKCPPIWGENTLIVAMNEVNFSFKTQL